MHILSRKRLRDFWQKHPQAERPLRAWHQAVKAARWARFADVRRTFAAADQVDRYIVFNVGGNRFRLACQVNYVLHRVYVRKVMTHAEYSQDRWKED